MEGMTMADSNPTPRLGTEMSRSTADHGTSHRPSKLLYSKRATRTPPGGICRKPLERSLFSMVPGGICLLVKGLSSLLAILDMFFGRRMAVDLLELRNLA